MRDMLATAVKLAAQQDGIVETLKWNERRLSNSLDCWLAETINASGSAVLIDVPSRAISIRDKTADETTIIWSCVDQIVDPVIGMGWRFSRRMPIDLSSDESTLLEPSKAVSTLKEREPTSPTLPETPRWVASGTVKSVTAPFLFNSLHSTDRSAALREIARVLTPDGCFATTVLASVNQSKQRSVNISGFNLTCFPQESGISSSLVEAGLHGIRLKPLIAEPVLTIDGEEIRAFTICAYSGTQGVCLDQKDVAVYLGPWSQVYDDDGHAFPRGIRIAVCAKTASVLQSPPYSGSFSVVKAYDRPLLSEAPLFNGNKDSAGLSNDKPGGDCGC